MTPKPPDRRRLLCQALTTTLLVTLAAACTGGSPAESGSRPLPKRSVGERPTLEAKPAPMEVTVAKAVGGRLSRDQRARLERQVAALLSTYFDDAFLGGDYPRGDFSDALDTFSPGAATRANSDRDLLTNRRIGRSTEAVVARTRRARLDVLVPGRRVAGLTARIRLIFLQQPMDGVEQRVTVNGRLLVDRKKSGAWQIFGYDVTRDSVPAGKEES